MKTISKIFFIALLGVFFTMANTGNSQAQFLEKLKELVEEAEEGSKKSNENSKKEAPQKEAKGAQNKNEASEKSADGQQLIWEKLSPNAKAEGNVTFEFTNATREPLAGIVVTHLENGKETIYKEMTPADEVASFAVPAGKSKIELVFARNSQLKVVNIPGIFLAGDKAAASLNEPDNWGKLENYKVRLPVSEMPCSVKYDNDGDGQYDTLVHFEEFGLYKSRISKYDVDADGKIDWIYKPIISNKEGGRNLGWKIDGNADGKWDSIYHYVYKEGYQFAVKETADVDGDEKIDWVKTYSFDPNNKSMIIKETWDTNNDGTPEKIRHHIYDGNIRIGEDWDEDADGIIDRKIRQFNHPEVSYLTQSEKVDSDADGNWDKITAYEYDEKNRRSKMLVDKDGDGAWDEIEHYKKLDEYPKRYIEIDTDGDGTIDIIRQEKRSYSVEKSAKDGQILYESKITYNIMGTIVKIEEDKNGDGKPDYVEKFGFSCHEGYNEDGPIIWQ